MQKKFRDVQESFDRLKKKYRQGKVSHREFIDRLKKMRLKEDDGRFWMIGAKSGKWYYFDGKRWIPSTPPSIQDGKAMCIYCGFENELETEICVKCGGNLGEKENFVSEGGKNKVESSSSDSDDFSNENSGLEEEEEDLFKENEGDLNSVLRYLDPFSFLVFCGTLGLPLGVIIGALAGASNYFSAITKIMPSFLRGIQGNLLGGIIYAGLGGAFGFIVLGFLGFCAAFFMNMASSFTGGIKIRIDKMK